MYVLSLKKKTLPKNGAGQFKFPGVNVLFVKIYNGSDFSIHFSLVRSKHSLWILFSLAIVLHLFLNWAGPAGSAWDKCDDTIDLGRFAK